MSTIPVVTESVTESASDSWATTCQNCGTALVGKFCPSCGQRAIPARPTVRQLAGDAWEEMTGWDGKFARTLRLLLGRPGELTVAVLEGRRARYVSPVRLYLMCSLFYFLLAAGIPAPQSEVAFDVGIGIGAEEADPIDAVFAKASASGLDSLTGEERAVLEAEIARNPALVRPVMRAIVADYAGLQARVLELLPQALFLLIPVLALVIGLFYRGRHYPEHLYAALHLQSFVFLVLAVVALASYPRSLLVFFVSSALSVAAIVAYAVVAQRRVYGGSWIASVAKTACITVVYWLLWSAVSFSVAVWVAAR